MRCSEPDDAPREAGLTNLTVTVISFASYRHMSAFTLDEEDPPREQLDALLMRVRDQEEALDKANKERRYLKEENKRLLLHMPREDQEKASLLRKREQEIQQRVERAEQEAKDAGDKLLACEEKLAGAEVQIKHLEREVEKKEVSCEC